LKGDTDLGVTPSLRVVTGPAAGRRFELRGESVIGRGAADVTIEDPELSRRHAVLRPTAHGVVVEDLGSSAGTFVDGRRIDEPTLIGETATLRLGGTVLVLGFPAPAVTETRAPIEPREVSTVAAAGSGPSTSPPPRRPGGRSGGRRVERRALVATVVLVVLGFGVAAAAGAAALFWGGGAKTHRLDIHGVVAVIEQVGQVGAPGSSQVEVARISGPPGGDGAAIQHAQVGPGGSVDGIAQLYFPSGSITVHYTGRASVKPDLSYRLEATEKVVASDGEYAGASGTQTIIGTGRIGAPTTFFHAFGVIKY